MKLIIPKTSLSLIKVSCSDLRGLFRKLVTRRRHLLITFRVSRIRREIYIGHARLSVCFCLSVRGLMPTLLHGPGCNLGNGKGCP